MYNCSRDVTLVTDQSKLQPASYQRPLEWGQKSKSLIPVQAVVMCGPLEKNIPLPSPGTKAGEAHV